MRLHHLEMCAKNGAKMAQFFIQKLDFRITAQRKTPEINQWVVSNQISPFIITESLNKTDSQPSRDSVFNVALLVDNVDELTEKMDSKGVQVVAEPIEIKDNHGSVIQSTVHTGFGNITHTFIDKRLYKGPFLPGFRHIDWPQSNERVNSSLTTNVDHVTYVCRPGEMNDILQWYKEWFGLERHIMNEYDDSQHGLVIGGNIGIRLKAAKAKSVNSLRDFFLVLAEPLTLQAKNHVNVFLEEHGGPGVEHIALSTDDIVQTVTELRHRGLQFRDAPKYGMLEEDPKAQETLRQLSILLDKEGDNSYLYQAFTLPIFDEPTLFMEIIQRQGAKAFGAANITRIMKSIENC